MVSFKKKLNALHHECASYRYKTNTIVFAVRSILKLTKIDLSGILSAKASLFAYANYSGSGLHCW